MDVVIIGSISYYFPLHQRLHHFTRHAVARGHRVLYVEVENARHRLQHPRRGSLEVWDNPRGEATVAMRVEERIARLRRGGWPGRAAVRTWHALRGPRTLRKAVREMQARHLVPESLSPLAAYRAKFAEFARADRRLVFLQAPYHVELLPWWKERGFRVVYDLVDEFGEFTDVPGPLVRAEEQLLRAADMVVATGRVLAQRARRANPRVVLVENGVEVAHFMMSRNGGPRPADLPPPGRPVVGYFGAIWDWFGSDWVRQAACARPQIDFVLIGTMDVANRRLFAGVPNIHYLGEKPYAELPHYLRHFTVAMIPFRENRLTRAVNPVKVYEYLCGGKPVVTSPLPEIEGLPGVLTARSDEEFVRLLDQALAWRPDLAEVDRVVQEHSWEVQFAKLDQGIDALWTE